MPRRLFGRAPLDGWLALVPILGLLAAMSGNRATAQPAPMPAPSAEEDAPEASPARTTFRPSVTATPSEPERVGLSPRDFTAADFEPTESQPTAAGDDATSDLLAPWVFVTIAATTAVLGGVTIWSGIDTLSKNGAYKDYARYPDAAPATARRDYADAHSAQSRTNILIGTTAVMAAASIAFGVWFTDWGSDRESQVKFIPYLGPAERAAGLQFEHKL
jgi:hypothetical protein